MSSVVVVVGGGCGVGVVAGVVAVKEGVEDPINVLMDGNIEKSLAI